MAKFCEFLFKAIQFLTQDELARIYYAADGIQDSRFDGTMLGGEVHVRDSERHIRFKRDPGNARCGTLIRHLPVFG